MIQSRQALLEGEHHRQDPLRDRHRGRTARQARTRPPKRRRGSRRPRSRSRGPTARALDHRGEVRRPQDSVKSTSPGRLRRRLSFGRHLHELDVRHALAHAGRDDDGYVGEHATRVRFMPSSLPRARGPMVASGGCERRRVLPTLRTRIARHDWDTVARALDEHGHAPPRAPDPRVRGGDPPLRTVRHRFRSFIDMGRHRFGEGDYRYFAPPPEDPSRPAEGALRSARADHNDWSIRLGEKRSLRSGSTSTRSAATPGTDPSDAAPPPLLAGGLQLPPPGPLRRSVFSLR